MAYLTIVTRCYKRPNMLRRHIESVEKMVDPDWEHYFIVDEVGIGVLEANKKFYEHRENIKGKWVLLLDDDDVLLDPHLVTRLKSDEFNQKDVVIAKMQHGNRELPPYLPCSITYGEICGSSFVVRNRVYQKYIDRFAVYPGGDYNFISAVVGDKKNRVGWLDVVITGIQQIGRGQPEALSEESDNGA